MCVVNAQRLSNNIQHFQSLQLLGVVLKDKFQVFLVKTASALYSFFKTLPLGSKFSMMCKTVDQVPRIFKTFTITVCAADIKKYPFIRLGMLASLANNRVEKLHYGATTTIINS